MEDDDIRFGPVVMQPSRRRLLRDGRALAVGARAFDVLAVLVAERHRMVTKAELLDAVWPDTVVEEANLAVQVSALRRLIGGEAIATVPGRGYRFVAPVADAAQAPGVGAPGDTNAPTAGLTTASSATDGPVPSALPRLPSDASTLIGRETELDALAAACSSARLVSIVGAGGIGKTRLALAYARACTLPDGVHWVDLSAVSRDEDVMATTAQACGVSMSPPGAAALAAALASKSMLLVLDNVEHVVGGAAPMAAALLAGAPRLKILVTGQVGLAIAGEHSYRLPPLGVPPPGQPADERYSAVRLFVERARADNLRFTADKEGLEDIAAICRALDGLPLAIELAAARVRLLGVRGVRERLDHVLRLLVTVRGHSSDLPRRHQALHATLSWSYGLLLPREKLLLQQLAPFVGGFTLELAQATAADDDAEAWDVLDALGALVDRSIVEVDGSEPPRYRLLETMRAFALDRLTDAGNIGAARTRHARAVAALFSRVTAQACGERQPFLTRAQAVALTLPEHDNARAALDWAMSAGDDAALAVDLAGTSATLAFQLGATHETVQRLLELRPHLGDVPPRQRAMLLMHLGAMGRQAGLSLAELRKIKEEFVREALADGSPWLRIRSLGQLAWAQATDGDTVGAQALAIEMRQLMQRDAPASIHVVIDNLQARICEDQGRYDEAIAILQALRTRLSSSPGMEVDQAMCEWNLCQHLLGAELHEQVLEVAQAVATSSHAPLQFRQSSRYCVVHALAAMGRQEAALALVHEHRRDFETGNLVMLGGCEALAMLALSDGRVSDAVRIFAVLERHYRVAGGRPSRLTHRVGERIQSACATRDFSDADLSAWRAAGEQLSAETLVAIALR